MSHKIFRSFFVLILVFGLVAVQVPQSARAAGPWYVSTTGNDADDCINPANPCATISGALNNPGFAAGDTILVAQGTYTSTSNNEVVLLDRDATLSGGWDTAFTLQSGTSTINGQGAIRGITVHSGVTATIERFVVQNSYGGILGGGIYNQGAVTLNNSTISGNTSNSPNSAGGGGGIGNVGTLTLNDSTVTGNFGSGISNWGVVTLNNSTISRNTASASASDIGGGISDYNGGLLTLNDSTVSSNTATSGGGIFAIQSGTIILNHSTVSNNTASGFGGGIFNSGANVTLTESKIINNTATAGSGGGIENRDFSTLMVTNTTISGNTASGYGGGIYNSGTLTVNNSTMSGNHGYGGGGIYNINGIATFDNGTIATNTSGLSFGGGVYSDGGGTVRLQNSIVAGNNTPEFTEDVYGNITSLGYNIIGNPGGFTPGTGDLINIDPKLGALLGSSATPTYHPLLPGSPAIDAGNPNGCTDQDGNLLTADQRGIARVGICDIGAYEYTISGPAVNLSVVDGNDQLTEISSAFSKPLRVAALDSQGSPVGGVTIDFTAPASGASGTFVSSGINTTSVATDEGGVATTSIFTANAQAGTYSLSAAAFGLESVFFSLKQVIRPANDNFADAEGIASLPFSASIDLTNAGIEPDETQHSCTNVEHSVWYSFTPTESMTIRINMQGNVVSSSLGAIYHADGPGIAGLSARGCAYSSNPPVNVHLDANEKYYLQVSSYAGEVGTVQVNLEQIPSPVNDNFINATQLVSLPISATADLTAAMIEPSEPQPCYFMDRSVWYTFTPTQNLVVRADTQGSSFYNTNVSVYRSTGTGITNLEFLRCSIFSGGTATFTAEANQTYYLQAGNAFGDVGTIQLNLQQLIPPPNDNFADAEAITSLPFSTMADINAAGNEPNEPQNCSSMPNTAWYLFTPTQTMMIQAYTQGGNFDTNMNVYRAGSGISDLQFLLCSSYGRSNGTPFNFLAEAGQVYYLQVGGLNGGIGTIQVNLKQVFPPANDEFVNARAVGSLPFSATVDITDATNDPSEPQYCYSMPNTVWYSFTPAEATLVRADTQGSAVSSNLNVYQPYVSGGLNFLGCSVYNGPITFLAEAGQTYYFQLGALNGEIGALHINLTELQRPANADFANAQAITSLPFNASQDVTNGGIEPNEPQNCYFMGSTIWYSFTPTENTLVRADTQGSAISSNLNVYHDTGSGISGLSLVPNGCTVYYGPVTFLAEAGQTYYLQAGEINASAGVVSVNLVQLPLPANDNFANATPIGSLPSTTDFDSTWATFQSNEPSPSCASPAPPYKTLWFAYTATQTGSISASIPSWNFTPFIAAYSGTGLNNLTQLGCNQYSNKVTFHVVNGQTYYFQVGGFYGGGGAGQFLLETTPPPQANFYFYPGDPSKYDTIQFYDGSYDPGQVGFQTFAWTFGDGSGASGLSPTHKYPADGDYQVTHTVTTIDGRTASSTQTVHIRTHDVAITKITAPNSANSGQTKAITVTLSNKAYPETVQVDLYKSTANGFVWVATVTKSVPALSGNRTTSVDFSYKFTNDDAKLGKVTFKAVATIINARDAYPADNEAISSPPTKVGK